MERSSKRGKIPQQDWPSIIARYEGGETLSSIARTYDCSPPAISYVVSRSRAHGVIPTAAAPSSPEPHLVKSHVTEPSLREAAPGLAVTNGPSANDQSPDLRGAEISGIPTRPEGWLPGEGDGGELHLSAARDETEASRGNLSPAPDPALARLENDEPRHILHLSLPHGETTQSPPDPRPHAAHRADPSVESSSLGSPSFAESGRQQENGASVRFAPEPQLPKDGGVFIDKALRERVESDITVFLAAFDAALTYDTPENRTGLREATDRLLRAGARTRIELERLEARMPLSSRSGSKQWQPAWRQR